MTKQSIVILHGWGSNPKRWIAMHDSLKAFSRDIGNAIHMPFLPGFDGNEPKKALNIDDYVLWLEKYIKDHRLRNIVLVGHSNGGRIAIRYAASHKEVQRLVLIAAAGIPNNRIAFKKTAFLVVAKAGKALMGPLKGTLLYRAAEKGIYKLARESDYYKASPVMKETMLHLLAYDATEDLKRIICPTLCVWGKNDTSTPLWMGEKMVAGIPRCTMKVVDGGHNIHVTNANEVATHIKDFLQT